jgi:hypothetical protein
VGYRVIEEEMGKAKSRGFTIGPLNFSGGYCCRKRIGGREIRKKTIEGRKVLQ